MKARLIGLLALLAVVLLGAGTATAYAHGAASPAVDRLHHLASSAGIPADGLGPGECGDRCGCSSMANCPVCCPLPIASADAGLPDPRFAFPLREPVALPDGLGPAAPLRPPSGFSGTI